MLQFVCDYCGNIRGPGENWINGVAVENVGTRAARREVVIEPAWRRERAVLSLAVHFCSVECKVHYLSELFSQPAPLLEIKSAEFEPAAGRRVVRARKKPASEVVRQRTSTSRRVGKR